MICKYSGFRGIWAGLKGVMGDFVSWLRVCKGRCYEWVQGGTSRCCVLLDKFVGISSG